MSDERKDGVSGPDPDPAAEPDPTADDSAPGAETDPDAELEWWQQPGMPFQQKPERLDYLLLFGIMFAGLFSLAILPFRVQLLVNAPYVLVALTGGSSALVSIGASIHVSEQLWLLALIMGALSVIKFDWLFWLAGRRWGVGLVDWMLGGMGQGDGWLSRMRSRIGWLTHRLAGRWAFPMILLTYVPVIPIPSAIVFGALGMGGMRLGTFLVLDFIAALANRGLYLYLGYTIGLPVLEVLEVLNRWALWITLGLLAVVIFTAYRRGSRMQQRQQAP